MAGEFGIVYKGHLVDHYVEEVVAIKTLKGIIVLMYKCYIKLIRMIKFDQGSLMVMLYKSC